MIDQGGKIAVPPIGNVKARGKTTNQLQAAIRSRLGAEYVKDPQVTVDIMQNRPFFILGEVRAPGQFPYASHDGRDRRRHRRRLYRAGQRKDVPYYASR